MGRGHVRHRPETTGYEPWRAQIYLDSDRNREQGTERTTVENPPNHELLNPEPETGNPQPETVKQGERQEGEVALPDPQGG